MRPIRRHLLHAGLALALGMVQPMRAAAEDIDLFVGSQPVGATGNPNVLVIIDDSSNWSAASQHWSGGVKQGQSELRALASVVLTLDASVNLGLMMLTAGSGSNPNGGYVRYAMRTKPPLGLLPLPAVSIMRPRLTLASRVSTTLASALSSDWPCFTPPDQCWLAADQLELLSMMTRTFGLPVAPTGCEPTNRSMSSAAARIG